jgi:hypothetical protein
MSRLIRCCLLLMLSAPLMAQSIPEALQDWQDWVLQEHPEARCSFQWNKFDRKQCIWPSRLDVRVEGNALTFTQQVDVEAEGWLRLPGNDKHWPQELRSDGQRLPVIKRDGSPAVHLKKGLHTLRGRIEWRNARQFLQLPADVGLVSLTRDGKSTSVDIDNKSRLWLRRNNTAKRVEKDVAPVRVQVFRRLYDSVPLGLSTVLQVEVSGEPKELLLSGVMLDGFETVSVESNLPARLEADGSLRLQARQGNWRIRIYARGDARQLQFALPEIKPPMPQQQIWVMESDPSLRSIDVQGAAQIDPSQSNLPDDWHGLPAYLMQADTQLVINERSRGDAKPAPNELKVKREFWLDFAGTGLTVSDNIAATVQSAMRLNTQQPFALGRAEIDGEPVLLSSMTSEQGVAHSGLEIAPGQLQLQAVSRIEEASQWRRVLPAIGWQHDADALKATVNLPPGWRVLAAGGVDSAPQTWLSQWSLFDIFMVLVIIMAFYRLFGVSLALPLAALLLIAYQDRDIPVTLWLVLAVSIGLLQVVDQGKLQRVLGFVRDASLLLLLFAALGFSAQRLQHAMYPVMAKSGSIYESGYAAGRAQESFEMIEESADIALSMPMSKSARRNGMEEVIVTAQKRVEREYDPDAYVQTGPGKPDWQWQSLRLQWSGPVLADQELVLYTLPPWVSRLLNILSVGLLALLMFRLLSARWQQRGGDETGDSSADASLVLKSLMVLFLLPVLAGAPQQSLAESLPDADMLQALEERLLKAPDCSPRCAAMASVDLVLSDDTLRLSLVVDSTSNTIVPLPGSNSGWQPAQISVNGVAATRLSRGRNGQLQLALGKGSHTIVLQGPLLKDDVSLPFALPAHNVKARVEGWQVSGISEGRLPNNTVLLKRSRSNAQVAAPTDTLLPAPVAAFVVVEREVNFDVDWRLKTRVRRVAPSHGVIDMQIPLLPGERVLDGVKAKDGHAQLRMAAGSSSLVWRSRLPVSENIVFKAPENKSWAEQWILRVEQGRWNMRWDGLAPIKQANAAAPHWMPRAGDTLTVALKKPEPLPGASQTLEGVDILVRPGLRSSEVEMSLNLRAGQGGNFVFNVPEGARILSLQADEQSLPLPNGQRVDFPVLPGMQRLHLRWQQSEDLGIRSSSPALDLGLAATNINIRAELPRERWMLLVGGPDMGPAVLFWGVLLVVIILALAMGRVQGLPLKTWEWLLLGVGLSTVNSFLGLAVVVWFLMLMWRGRQSQTTLGSWFNMAQFSLIIASAIALLCLLSAIPLGLLSTPNMHIAGNGSSNYLLQWYQDRASGVLPQGWFVSLPLWVYRAAMLMWSLWIASALMRWLPWAWQQFTNDGWWVSSQKSNSNKKAETNSSPDNGEKDNE